MNKFTLFISLFLFTVIIIIHNSCEKKPKVAAEVGNIIISQLELSSNLKEKYRLDTLTSLTNEQKIQTLNQLIERKLKYLAAKDSGFTEDAVILAKVKNRVLNKLYKKITETAIQNELITEKRKKQFYSDLKQLVKVRNILIHYEGAFRSNSKRKEKEAFQFADSLKSIIGKKGSFAFIAHKYSEGIHAEKGGNLGYVAKSSIEKVLGEAIFNAPLNEVSGPFKSKYGIHLILVEDFKNNDNMKPYKEMEQHIERYIKETYKIQVKEILDNHFKKISDDYKYEINENGLTDFIPLLNQWSSNPPLLIDSLFIKVKDIVLMQSGSFKLTAGEFLFSVNRFNKNFNRFNNEDKLTEYLENKKEFYSWVLEAINNKYDKEEDIQKLEKSYLENLAIFKLETTWRMQVQIPEEQVKLYYHNNKDKFLTGQKGNIKKYEEVSLNIKRELLSKGVKEKNNNKIEQIKKKYSVTINEKNVRDIK